MSNYHLTYIGADGIVFDSLQPGRSIDPQSVNLRLSKGHAFFALKDLPSGAFGPPERVWTNGLSLFFPGSDINLATGKIKVPIASLLAPFFHHPFSASIVQEILLLSSAWVFKGDVIDRATRFPDGPHIDDFVKQWIVERDSRWEANSDRRSVCTTPYVSWSFLDLIALANWDQVRIECRIDNILFALVVAVNAISSSEAEYLADLDAEGLQESRETAFYNYVSDRKYPGIALGPLSNKEKVAILGGLEAPDPQPDPPGFKLLEESTLGYEVD